MERGFTLLEIMLSIALLTIISGMLYALAASFGVVARSQESQMAAMGETRVAMLQIGRELRQAAQQSIVLPNNAANTIQYRIPADMSGNGLPVDQTGRLELGPLRTIGRDVNDLNNDGLTLTQLIWTDGTQVRVLANNLLLDEVAAGQDINGNGVLERGLWFERVGGAIRVTVQAENQPDPTSRVLVSTMTQSIVPRN